MRPQEPPFPSFSLVLSQPSAQSSPPSYVVFPWASISYQSSAALNANPVLVNVAPQPQTHAPNNQNPLQRLLSVIHRVLGMIAAKLWFRT
ncbi:hypothetical protein B0H11DRAFT_2233693 [Mycena galericulata]|nr:hypothetical protein B0H11DRAFT_2233693 [Mycena galericulata]